MSKVLPAATPPISLDTLLVRAQGGAVLRTDRAADRTPGLHSFLALEKTARSRSEPAHGRLSRTVVDARRPPVASLSTPTKLLLFVTVATCECGVVARLPASSCIVLYGSENERAPHQSRLSLKMSHIPDTLPREVRERHIAVPFCEACFS